MLVVGTGSHEVGAGWQEVGGAEGRGTGRMEGHGWG